MTDAAIDCRNLWKIFGAEEATALAAAREGVGKDEFRERFDCVVALADVTLRSGRRDLLRHGPVGQRQVDPGPPDQPAYRAQRGRRRRRWAGRDVADRGSAARAARPAGRHGVPERGAPAAPHGPRKRRAAARAAWSHPGRALARRAKSARDGAARRLGGCFPRSAVRRHAPARRARPCPCGRSRDPADGRALQRSRPADPAPVAGRVPEARAPHAQDDGVHHPRPRRSAAPGGSHRDHEGRPIVQIGTPERIVTYLRTTMSPTSSPVSRAWASSQRSASCCPSTAHATSPPPRRSPRRRLSTPSSTSLPTPTAQSSWPMAPVPSGGSASGP